MRGRKEDEEEGKMEKFWWKMRFKREGQKRKYTEGVRLELTGQGESFSFSKEKKKEAALKTKKERSRGVREEAKGHSALPAKRNQKEKETGK